MSEYVFPKNFLFGVATSAPQVEGAAAEDGRGPSIWDEFAKLPGKIYDGTRPDVTCDQYHHYREDAKLMKELGINSYRFSFSWSRILPEGKGAINQKGLDYYKRLLDALDENGILPNATLYHWDLPHALDQLGGWYNRDAVNWYADYAELLFRSFGDRIPYWATFNEPIATYIGYSGGRLAPGRGDEKSGRQANHHLLLAHGEGVRRFREIAPKAAQIGIVVDIWQHWPYRPDHTEDIALAELENEKSWRSYLNPLFKGAYTPELLAWMEQESVMPDIRPGDMERICQPLDFYGMNVYNRIRDCADPDLMARETGVADGGNVLVRDFYPKAVYDAVKMLRERYDLRIPVLITENGDYAVNEKPDEQGKIHDGDRVRYLEGFLHWIGKALEEGADIRGYYVWSLMDNWEWSAGKVLRYGLCYTDYETQQRIPKDSAYWYKAFIQKQRET